MADPIGIDFGGSGIKAAPVNLGTGEFAADRERIDTPEDSTPEAVAKVMAELLERFEKSDSPVGVTIPGVVRRNGVVASAANIDKSWIGTDADDLLEDKLGRTVRVINDADAAGLAEARYGVATGREGLVIVTTLGWCPTPSSATSRSTGTTPRPRLRTPRASATSSPGTSGPSGSRPTTRRWRSCSPPTSS
jgi:polyphosphate glucokinase